MDDFKDPSELWNFEYGISKPGVSLTPNNTTLRLYL